MVAVATQAHQRDGACRVCDGQPRVLVVMRHPTMRRLTRELLEREFACWVATEARADDTLARMLDRLTPDLLIIDAAAFPTSCLAALAHIPRDRVIVIGPEPDPSYRAIALASGAGGWLPRDHVADELSSELRRVLGCGHAPCPPGQQAGELPSSGRDGRYGLRIDDPEFIRMVDRRAGRTVGPMEADPAQERDR